MKNIQRFKFLTLMISTMLLIVFITSCSAGNKADNNGDQAVDKTAGASASNTGTADSNSEVKQVSPVSLNFFLENWGWTIDDSIDINNNPWIDYVNQKANVKLNITFPTMAESEEKFKLLVSTGDLPDMIFGRVRSVKNPEDGLLLPLDDYIKNSAALSQFHTPELYDVMRAKDGKIYLIRSSRKDNMNPVMWNMRLDLVEECFGKVPETLDEWFECLKAVKQKYPDSTPMTSFDGLAYMNHFLQSFGVDFVQNDNPSQPFRLINGKVTNVWSMPQMKEALDFYKKLYNAGVIDKEFATNKVNDFINKYYNNNLTLWSGNLYGFNPGRTVDCFLEGRKDFVAATPTIIAPGVDPQNALYSETQLGDFAMGISSACKNPEAAVKAMEVFCSDEYMQYLVYGREGVEHTVKDGQKVTTEEYDKTNLLRMILRFSNDSHIVKSVDLSVAIMSKKITDKSLYDKFHKYWKEDMDIAEKQLGIVGNNPFEFFESSPSAKAIYAKYKENMTYVAVNYITSKISDGDYEKEVNQIISDLAPIGEEIQEYCDNK
ncbi:MAG: hypothetical protein ABFD25_18950 [Clostridiaceae bacterium]